MAYEILDPSAKPLLYVYIIVAVLATIMTILMLLRWRERKKIATKYLFLSLFFLWLSIILLTIGFAEAFISGYKKELYRLTMGISFGLNMLFVNVNIIKFAAEIFSLEKKRCRIYIIISVVIGILVLLPNNYYGYPSDAEIGYGPSIRMYTSILMILFSLFMFSRISYLSFQTMKQVSDNYAKKGFAYIGLSQLSFLAFYLCLTIDTIIFTFASSGGYSIFVYLAWASAIGYFIFSYLGLVQPSIGRKKAKKL